MHACAIRPEGELWCWGQAHLLGFGEEERAHRPPVLVPTPEPVVALSLGFGSTLVVTGAGEVWGWSEAEVPTRVEGISEVVAVSQREWTACALRSDGTVWCWGDNDLGQLGLGTSEGPERCGEVPCSSVPVEVPGLTGMVDLSLGRRFGCALSSTGEVFCWGENYWGQLGIGQQDGPETCVDSDTGDDTACSTVPVRVESLNSVIAISAGYNSTCAIREDGAMWCWGRNLSGELGIGEGGDGASAVPVRVADSYE